VLFLRYYPSYYSLFFHLFLNFEMKWKMPCCHQTKNVRRLIQTQENTLASFFVYASLNYWGKGSQSLYVSSLIPVPYYISHKKQAKLNQ